MKNRIKIITSILIVMTILGGCSSKIEEKIELTDRQMDILISEDLPTDWNELTGQQQESIMAIEEMLQYLEEKYDKEFVYKGYRADNLIYNDEESLLVYAKGDNPDTDCFTVERTEDGFEDDYETVLAQDGYHEKIENSIREYLEGKTYKLLTSVGKIDEEKGFPRGTVHLFIKSDEIEDRINTTNELDSILFNIEGVDNIKVYYLDDVEIYELTLKNWEDKIDEENLVERFSASGRQWRKNQND